MPICVECNEEQWKLSAEHLCIDCNTYSTSSTSDSEGGDGMNEYYYSNILSTNNPINLCPSPDQTCLGFDNTSDSDTPTQIDPSKSLASLTVADLMQILQPIHTKIDKVNAEIIERLTSLESRLENVEVKNEILKHLAILSEGVTTVQKSLDQMALKAEKEVNIMISDLAEGDIELDEGNVIDKDHEKFNYLLNSIGIRNIPEETVNGFRYQRIGVPSADTTRVLKITVDKKEGDASRQILWHLWNLFR